MLTLAVDRLQNSATPCRSARIHDSMHWSTIRISRLGDSPGVCSTSCARGHGTSSPVPIEVTKNNVRVTASSFPVVLNIPVNCTLAVDTPHEELMISPSRGTHQSVDNRFVCRSLNDDLGVDVAPHCLPGSERNRASVNRVDALRLGQAGADHGFDAWVIRLREQFTRRLTVFRAQHQDLAGEH